MIETPAATNRDIDVLARQIVDSYQHDFPLTPRPYAAIAEALGVDESEVLACLESLQESGTISRIGAVIAPHTVGRSTLAAMSVPHDRLEEVAELVNGYREVNHNYEREHHFNLWFVVTAVDFARVAEVLAEIGKRTGLKVLDLPLVEAYHIDLGFPLQWS
jgi:DNA-binding Lrp family transcriptional regulator